MTDSRLTKRIAAGAAALALGVGALVVAGVIDGPQRPAPPAAEAPGARTPATTAAAPAGGPVAVAPSASGPAAAPSAAPATAEAAAPAPKPEAGAPAATPGTQAEKAADGAPATPAPSFDVVRVEPDGAALVAGRAAPGATVEVKLDGATVAETKADASGQFVAFAQTPTGATAKELTLFARAPDGSSGSSTENVIILPRPAEPAAAGASIDAAAATTAATGAGGAAATSPAASGSATSAGAGAETAAGAGEGPATGPVLVRAAAGGGLAVVDPESLGPADSITLDSVTYTGTGAVSLAGRGRAGATARIYADDLHQADAAIGEAGAWRATLAGLARPGVYRLRIDEVDAAGRVASRIETPFVREAPETLAAALAASPGQVVVQPGHSLWAIARARYGHGTDYALIYAANRERIRDPHLIYPGQVFDLPSAPAR